MFSEARRRGFVLCNFFQLEDGSFRCNWIANGKGHRFGEDPDPEIAATIALEHASATTEDEEDLIG